MTKWIMEKIVGLMERRFYGALTIQFNDGRIAHIKTEETEKPPVDLE